MGRIRPFKMIGTLAILFVIFSMMQMHKAEKKPSDSNTTKTLSHKEKTPAKPFLTQQDGLKVLNYLFHDKIQDSAMNCRLKRAKTRTFIGCTEGAIIQDNYWEVQIIKKRLKLIARSKTAIYLAQKYRFKELRVEQKQAHPKVEKALIHFFKN